MTREEEIMIKNLVESFGSNLINFILINKRREEAIKKSIEEENSPIVLRDGSWLKKFLEDRN